MCRGSAVGQVGARRRTSDPLQVGRLRRWPKASSPGRTGLVAVRDRLRQRPGGKRGLLTGPCEKRVAQSKIVAARAGPCGSAAVYLLDDERGQIRVAMTGGSARSLFAFPGRMGLDARSSSRRSSSRPARCSLLSPSPSATRCARTTCVPAAPPVTGSIGATRFPPPPSAPPPDHSGDWPRARRR